MEGMGRWEGFPTPCPGLYTLSLQGPNPSGGVSLHLHATVLSCLLIPQNSLLNSGSTWVSPRHLITHPSSSSHIHHLLPNLREATICPVVHNRDLGIALMLPLLLPHSQVLVALFLLAAPDAISPPPSIPSVLALRMSHLGDYNIPLPPCSC